MIFVKFGLILESGIPSILAFLCIKMIQVNICDGQLIVLKFSQGGVYNVRYV